MRDKHHAAALGLALFDDLIDALAALLGKCGRRFIHDEDAGVRCNGPRHLDHFPCFKRVFIRHCQRIDFAQAVFVENSSCLRDDLLHVHKAELGQLALLAEENVLGDRAALRPAER